ncbi:MAG TPA: hypothetical protein VHZ52_08430 [Acidobacteriaceae bacterium]|jgi:hypothetical protein|nr:hypothetical protein [Acidobacteriaceae bacterium]
MIRRSLGFALTLLLTFVALCAAANAAPGDSVFVGKWKLDPAHSRLTDQMKVVASAPNTYTLNFSGDNVETIVADGTDQPGLFDSTFAITVQDEHNWKCVRKKDGKTTIIGLWQLSADGKTLTDNFTGYRDNGTTSNLHYIYQRIAGPDSNGMAADGKTSGFVVSGFIGTWESVQEDVNSPQELEVKPFEEDGLSFVSGGGQVIQSLHFDGKDYPGSGPGVPQGYTSSGHRISDHAVDRVDKINGKTLNSQEIEISPDGKTLKATIHMPGRERPDWMLFNRE